MKMEHCFFRMDDDPTDNEELNFFTPIEEEDVIFYSQNMISDGEGLQQDNYEAYFDV